MDMSKRIRIYIFSLAVMVALALPFTVSSAISAEPVAVIVNNSNDIFDLGPDSIKKIYNNNILKWPDGTPILIYDLGIDSPLRETFSSRILGRSPEKIAEEWAHKKITNQALNPPVMIKHENLIIRKVAVNKGAIGYVSLSMASNDPDVRIVFIFN